MTDNKDEEDQAISDKQALDMAENKRSNVAGKIATPNMKDGVGLSKDMINPDSSLYKAIGAR